MGEEEKELIGMGSRHVAGGTNRFRSVKALKDVEDGELTVPPLTWCEGIQGRGAENLVALVRLVLTWMV